MKTFYVRAEPFAAGPSATAIVIAADARQALVRLRKNSNFSGYRLPPAEMLPFEASNEQVRQVLGDQVAQVAGVYGFTTIGGGEPEPADVPPATVS